MRNYNQFLNELRSLGKMNDNLPIDFKFAINVENITDTEKYNILSEFSKYVEIDNYVIKSLISKSVNNLQAFAWIINIYESYGNTGESRLTIKFDKITISNNDIDYNNIISAKEFLEIGLEKVKDYFDMINNTKKYNL